MIPLTHALLKEVRLTNCPVHWIIFNFILADGEPDAGHPMSSQRKHGHEQREDEDAVLGVPVQLLQQPRQPQQSCHFQQMDEGALLSTQC